MPKQPRFFYASKTDNPDLVEQTPAVEKNIKIPEFKLSPKILLGAGVFLLLTMASLGFLRYQTTYTTLSLENNHNRPMIMGENGQSDSTGLRFEVRVNDARTEIIRSFLDRYNSPLEPHDHFASVLVEAADRYGLDYRLLPAIMMQESNLCKTSDPSLHNCLGFGIHKAGTLGFDSYEDSFDRAARELKQRYIDIGLTSPEEIMTKYTPSSPNKAWANSVNQWIEEMEFNSREKGLENTSDADLTIYPQQISSI